jgi:autotransporter-associated beta strand protein
LVSGGGLAFGGAVSTTGNTLTVTGANNTTISGVISGGGGVIKSAAGALTFPSSVTHTYTGTTSVTGGTLRVDGTLAAGGGAVSVGNGAPDTGTLAGAGTVSRDVNINNGGTVSPGNGVPGDSGIVANLTLDTGVVTLNSGGTYQVQVTTRADQGSAGADWDHLTLTSLSVAATPEARFKISLISLTASNVPGPLPGWDQEDSQTWTIATVPAANVSGFNPAKFQIDTTQFTNHNPVLANFYVWQDGNAIKLTYVPEPAAAWCLLAGGLLVRRRRR